MTKGGGLFDPEVKIEKEFYLKCLALFWLEPLPPLSNSQVRASLFSESSLHIIERLQRGSKCFLI